MRGRPFGPHGAAVLAVLLGVLWALAGCGAGEPAARVTATCGDHDTQAEAQRARDTRDADGDGVYCVISPR